MPFYGNITNKRNQFTYDKVYPNKKAMLEAVSAANVQTVQIIDSNEVIIEKNDDGVFIGRYVLIDYGITKEEHDNNYLIDNSADFDTQRSWDSTVWQKVYVNNILTYVLIAELNAKQADVELLRYSPSYRSPGQNLKQPLTYETVIGKENSFVVKAQDNYQIDIEVPAAEGKKFLQFPVEDYIFSDPNIVDVINIKGFDPKNRSYINDTVPEFSITSSISGEKYYTDNVDENEMVQDVSPDILKWKIDLRALGNIASNFYDILYSQNRDAVEFLEANSIHDVSTEGKSLNKLYCINSTYYYITEEGTWAIALDLNRSVGEDGSNSLFELLLNLRHLENLLVEKSESVSDMQMNLILSYFDSTAIPETNSQLGEIMELKYLGYDNISKIHKMQFTKSFEKVTGILSATVKFETNFTYGDKITLYKQPIDGKEDGTNPFISSTTGEPVEFEVIMTNGVEATTNAWSANTVGLINFGLEDDKAYIYSAVPIWG